MVVANFGLLRACSPRFLRFSCPRLTLLMIAFFLALSTFTMFYVLPRSRETTDEVALSTSSSKLWPLKAEGTKSMAKICLYRHNIDEAAWKALDETSIHIVYFVWLPTDGNGRRIVEAQWRTLKESGLLARPKTFLHIAMQTQSDREKAWFKEYFSDHDPNYEIDFFIDNHNYYEFIGIRWLYELACQNPESIMLYFHNKGARYGHGQRLQEAFLTTQTISHWRDVLSLMSFKDYYGYYNVAGGDNRWVWYNFYWVWAKWYQTSPRPHIDTSRFYYETWSGQLDEENEKCSNLTGLEVALKEKPWKKTGSKFKETKYYSFVNCDAWPIGNPETEALFRFVADPLMSDLLRDHSHAYFEESLWNYTLQFHTQRSESIRRYRESEDMWKNPALRPAILERRAIVDAKLKAEADAKKAAEQEKKRLNSTAPATSQKNQTSSRPGSSPLPLGR